MNYLVHLEKKNNIYVVSSRVIAKEIGKDHSKVIRTLDEILEKPNVASLIIPSTYKVKGQKREYKEYLLTKDGFTLYMFNIQGYLDFKMAYINEFNRMEQVLKNPKQEQTKLDFQEKDIIRTTWKGQPVMELVQLARYIHIREDNLHWHVRNNKLTLRYGDLEQYKEENPKAHSGRYSSISILSKEQVIGICKKYGVYEKYKDFIENYFRVDNRLEDKTPKVPVVRANFNKEPFEDKYYNRMFECMKKAYIIESRIEKIYEEELLPLYNKIEELNRAKKDCLISPFNAMKYGSVLGKAKLNK
jgi:Rha family phage regulatory protein